MGVSGCGKTTIGRLLATEMGLTFFDADDFHSQSNIDKMKNNIPLSDEDRFPWLNILALNMLQWKAQGGFVLSCSALKECYRKILSSNISGISWIYLEGTLDLIHSRLKSRDHHYMKSSLLQSQFDILEVPNYGLHLSTDQLPQVIVKKIQSKLNLNE